MNKIYKLFYILILQILILNGFTFSQTIIPATDPNIQYYGRWDFSNPSAPEHSWPGVYIIAYFEGTSISVRLNDNTDYFNVFIDDTIHTILHTTYNGLSTYSLAKNLPDGNHKLLFTLRNETNWIKFPFNGFVLDSGKTLLSPPVTLQPSKRIEFIGDSYTCAAGNLWTQTSAAPDGNLYTDEFEGFAPITANYFNADYHITGRSGYGLVQDYLGNASGNLPDNFNRTLVYTASPIWDFSKWIPNVVVICLGLNDYSGWNGYNSPVPLGYANLYKSRYHDFISTINDVYPGVKILTVAPNNMDWLKTQISQVAKDENALEHKNVYYTYFPYYTDGYVNGGHPNVASHQKIAQVLISAIDSMDYAWQPYVDKTLPEIVSLPDTPLVVSTLSYLLTVKTDKYATVRYSTSDKPYDQMENIFTTTGGTRVHSVTLSCNQKQQYTYYLRAMDQYGNKMDSSAVIKFTADTTKAVLVWNASTAYNVSGWKKGAGPLGNDNSDYIVTTTSPASTVYFRHIVNFSNIQSITSLSVYIFGHDGAIVYLNGHEIGRINIDPKAIPNSGTFAILPMDIRSAVNINASTGLKYLKNGDNVFAVEMHSKDTTNTSILFDAQVYDSNNNIYYDFGSEWSYYDAGSVPANQIGDNLTGIVADNNSLPKKMYLYPNYPNPFNPSTNITFDLSKKSHVELKVYNLLGQLVATLADKDLNSGEYTINFNAHNMASGVYFYQLKTDTFTEVKKMVLMK
jgi:hypothetical protein